MYACESEISDKTKRHYVSPQTILGRKIIKSNNVTDGFNKRASVVVPILILNKLMQIPVMMVKACKINAYDQ